MKMTAALFVAPAEPLILTSVNLDDPLDDEVVRHCREVLPGHMVARYVEIVPSLPKTPTQKIQRRKLIESAFTPTTWDAQANDWVRPTYDSKETA